MAEPVDAAHSPPVSCCQVNPPFSDGMIDAAADHMDELLGIAQRHGEALCFAVVLPGWADSRGWRALSGHALLRHRLLVAAADHGFVDGAVHSRNTARFRESPYDTGAPLSSPPPPPSPRTCAHAHRMFPDGQALDFKEGAAASVRRSALRQRVSERGWCTCAAAGLFILQTDAAEALHPVAGNDALLRGLERALATCTPTAESLRSIGASERVTVPRNRPRRKKKKKKFK